MTDIEDTTSRSSLINDVWNEVRFAQGLKPEMYGGVVRHG